MVNKSFLLVIFLLKELVFPNEQEKKVLRSLFNSKFTVARVSHERINRLYTDLWFLKSKYGIRYLIPPKTIVPSFFLMWFS